MALRFCTCGTLVEQRATDKLTYKCGACKKKYAPGEDDTLLYEDIEGNNTTNRPGLIRNAHKDRLNPIKQMKCPECKKITYVNYLTLGAEMSIVYTCLDCHHQWR
jgi:DNA-directed RNA polymerase subunit M/transcription elongation factor TFIIS